MPLDEVSSMIQRKSRDKPLAMHVGPTFIIDTDL